MHGRTRVTAVSVALGTGVALAAAPVAGANLTDAIGGYTLAPAERMLAGERVAAQTRGQELAEDARAVAEDALGERPLSRAEQELREAGVDTDALRRAVERSLDDLGR